MRLLGYLWQRHGYAAELSELDRADLVAYRDHPLARIQNGSWNTEMGCLSGFITWAQREGLMRDDPIPRWGSRQRNTLTVREADERARSFSQTTSCATSSCSACAETAPMAIGPCADATSPHRPHQAPPRLRLRAASGHHRPPP